MKYFQIIIFLLLISQGQRAISQNTFKFGKIDLNDFYLQSSIDSSAAAEFIESYGYDRVSYQRGKINFDQKVIERIQIFDKDNSPEDILNLEILLYDLGGIDREELASFKAYIHNNINGDIQSIKLRYKDVIIEQYNENYKIAKIAFPAVEDGSIIEWSYTISSPFFREIDQWNFQKKIPSKLSNLIFQYPSILQYQKDIRGEFVPQYENTTSFDNLIGNNVIFEKYKLENINPIEKEPFVLNPRNLISSIRHELKVINIPGVTYESYIKSWDQVGNELLKHPDFGGVLKVKKEHIQTVDQLITENMPFEERTKTLFDYVKDNIRFTNNLGILCENGKKTLDKKEGNGADLNIQLINFLKAAKIKAYPIAISTINNGVLNTAFPSITKLNHVITLVKIDDLIYLMDPSSKYSKINLLPIRDLNQYGLKISDEGSNLVSLFNSINSTHRTIINVEFDEALDAKLQIRQVRDNYFVLQDAQEIENDEAAYIKKRKETLGYNFNSFKLDLNDTKDKITETYTFDYTGEDITNTPDKLILNPLLFLREEENIFKKEERKYPIELGAPTTFVKIVFINLPDGFNAKKLPENQSFEMRDQLANYKFETIHQGDKLIFKATQTMLLASYPAEYYNDLKAFYQKIVDIESQPIIIER